VWSATSLLQEPLLANRVRMMKQLIMISQSLRQLNNLHLLTAIISGLSNSAVLRLKWTRLKLPKQVLKIMEDLEGTYLPTYLLLILSLKESHHLQH
jgi:hypothetical protein